MYQALILIIVFSNLPRRYQKHTIVRGDIMNSCELTASVTALANALACKLSDDELSILAAVLVQLGDTIVTIVTQRSICDKQAKK